MKFLSINVRGLGGLLKKKEVGKLVKVERLDFLFLQKTKLEEVDGDLCRMWNSDGFDWDMKMSTRALGGLLCVWDKLNFVKMEEFTSDGCLGVSREWRTKKLKCYFVNVYAPKDRRKKVELWEELRKVIIEKGGRWLIASDFNTIRCLEEKRRRIGENPEMRDFNAFIKTIGLVDIRLANRRFTMSRCEQKLRLFKEILKGWNRKVFRDMEVQFDKASKRIEHVDMKNEECDLEDYELEDRHEGFQEMWAIMRKREAIWKQT
ncbi:hypothetical protein SLA2020_100520 [Shorea laevis]